MTLLPGWVSQTMRQHGAPSLDVSSLWSHLPHGFSHSFSCLALNHDEDWGTHRRAARVLCSISSPPEPASLPLTEGASAVARPRPSHHAARALGAPVALGKLCDGTLPARWPVIVRLPRRRDSHWGDPAVSSHPAFAWRLRVSNSLSTAGALGS